MKVFEGFKEGINLGGWISQFDKFDIEHFDTFITKKDIDYIASIGYDHVRVPVDYTLFENDAGDIKELGFKYLDNCLKWCKANNLKMIIDVHEVFGYSFDPSKPTDKEIFFYDEKLQQRFLNLWKRIATHYKDYSDIIAFEPLNEVVLFSVKDAWNKVIRKFIETVRPICPKTYLIIGGVCYNHVTTVQYLDKPYDDHIVYNFHCYEPLIFTHQGAHWMKEFPKDFRISYPCDVKKYREEYKRLFGDEDTEIFKEQVTEMSPKFFEFIFTKAIEAAEKYDVALYCGEYGVIDLADEESKKKWLKDIRSALDNHLIGRALWNYKEKDFGIVHKDFPNQ